MKNQLFFFCPHELSGGDFIADSQLLPYVLGVVFKPYRLIRAENENFHSFYVWYACVGVKLHFSVLSALPCFHICHTKFAPPYVIQRGPACCLN